MCITRFTNKMNSICQVKRHFSRILNVRSVGRMHTDINQVLFKYKHKVDKKIYRAPLECFVYKQYVHKDIVRILRDFHIVARQYPDTYRKCVTCDNEAYNGDIFCRNFNMCDAFRKTRFYKVLDEDKLIRAYEDDRTIPECYICRNSEADKDTDIVCDECNRVCHLNCIGLCRVPAGNWSCTYCVKIDRKGKKMFV